MGEEKVLVIDGEESTCNLIKSALGARGFQVRVAQAAKVGLQLYNEEPSNLVFVDLDIPDMDARYLIRELKRQDGNIGIVILSYPDKANLVQESTDLGAADFLYKPLKSDEIHFKARHALDYAKFVSNNIRSQRGIEERNLSLQKQNLLLAKRIEESTKNLTRLYEDLKETYMRTIKALAHAIDARDHYTYAHSDNVMRYSEMIARQMNVDMSYVEDIKDACQLHDLGKIGVHDSILSKPGALTQEEFAEIRLHSQKGAQILEPLRFLDNVIAIVKHHHERWDGKGYPSGLKGEDIPLGSRIMAVADSYDAMISARPYRKVGLSQKEAIEEITKNRGIQFDSKVVDAFLKIVDKI
ncbi:MAG: HD domain-containing phosphohydrolase [Candidatus Omnitrophota bacterium]